MPDVWPLGVEDDDPPILPPNLNPDVPEFIPNHNPEMLVEQLLSEDTDGTDGDDESEDDNPPPTTETATGDTAVGDEDQDGAVKPDKPGLVLSSTKEDAREKMEGLLETPPNTAGSTPSSAPTTEWVEVRKRSKEERKSAERGSSLPKSSPKDEREELDFQFDEEMVIPVAKQVRF